MTELSKHKRIFVDTAPFIYFFEGNSDLSVKSRDLFLKLINEKCEIYTSYITEIEMKILPTRNRQTKKLIAMDTFIEEFGIDRLNLGTREYKTALEIRAYYPFIKLIDAFQLAIALNSQCNYFVTNDKDLKRYDQINVILIEDYGNFVDSNT